MPGGEQDRESPSCKHPRGFADAQVDIPLLYVPVTQDAIENAYSFYGIWWEAPGAVKVCPGPALLFSALLGRGSMRACATVKKAVDHGELRVS